MEIGLSRSPLKPSLHVVPSQISVFMQKSLRMRFKSSKLVLINKGAEKRCHRDYLTWHKPSLGSASSAHFSKAKMCFQSFFILMTVQPCFFAMSYISWLKVPTLVSGSPCAGPYAYSRVASSCITTTDNLAPVPAFTYSNICWSSLEELPNAAYGRRP